MIRSELVDKFRVENPEITVRVITNAVLYVWCTQADKDFCARTRCIVNDEPETITTSENDQSFDLEAEITSFFDIDEWPGGGVIYNNKQLKKTTPAELFQLSPNWLNRASGVPKKYFRRGKSLWLDRPIDSAADDILVYAVLNSNDWTTDVAPYNELEHLEAFHEGISKYLQWRCKAKVGKPNEAKTAMTEYLAYTLWVKKELGGGKYGSIYLRKSDAYA